MHNLIKHLISDGWMYPQGITFNTGTLGSQLFLYMEDIPICEWNLNSWSRYTPHDFRIEIPERLRLRFPWLCHDTVERFKKENPEKINGDLRRFKMPDWVKIGKQYLIYDSKHNSFSLVELLEQEDSKHLKSFAFLPLPNHRRNITFFSIKDKDTKVNVHRHVQPASSLHASIVVKILIGQFDGLRESIIALKECSHDIYHKNLDNLAHILEKPNDLDAKTLLRYLYMGSHLGDTE